MSNNNNKKGRKRAQGQMAALLNEVQQLKASAKRNGGNAKPRRRNQGSVNALGSAPVAQSRVRVNPPRAKNGMSRDGARTIVFEEYVQDITSSATSGAFSVQSFPLQPGLSTLFAWLAEQAINYQEYRFKRVAFRFETDQTTALAGKIMYAFSPDAADANPANKQEMLEYGCKGKSAVWQEFSLPIPVGEALGAKRYIRSGTLAANLDIKTYDLGILFVATSGVVGTSVNVGELYVEYEVELMVPVVQSLAAAQARSISIVGATAISETVLFGTAPTTTGGLAVVPSTTDATLTFNRVGNYIIAYVLAGTGLFTSFTPTFTVSGCSATSLAGISNAAANAGTAAVGYFVVAVNTRGATCLIDVTASATTVTATSMRIGIFAAA